MTTPGCRSPYCIKTELAQMIGTRNACKDCPQHTSYHSTDIIGGRKPIAKTHKLRVTNQLEDRHR